jgi:hypothetical protein
MKIFAILGYTFCAANQHTQGGYLTRCSSPSVQGLNTGLLYICAAVGSCSSTAGRTLRSAALLRVIKIRKAAAHRTAAMLPHTEPTMIPLEPPLVWSGILCSCPGTSPAVHATYKPFEELVEHHASAALQLDMSKSYVHTGSAGSCVTH